MRPSLLAKSRSHPSPAVRIKLDENLPAELAEDLRRLGHDADTVGEEDLAGAGDQAVSSAAARAGRVLFTLDKGIGDVRRFNPSAYAGIVLFRFEQHGRGTVRQGVLAAMEGLSRLPITGRLVVATPTSLRVR